MDVPLFRLSPPEVRADDPYPTEPVVVRGQPDRRPPWWVPALAVAGEALVAVLAACVLLQLSRGIVVDPLDRIGQVSGLAGIGLRYTVLGLLLLAVVVAALQWRGGKLFPLAGRFACAAVAGLTSGFVGSGLLIALAGTSWPLYGPGGDAGVITAWIADVQEGQSVPEVYPPLAIHLMAWWADLTGSGAPGALRAGQILGTALFGPLVYLAWRLLLSPPWALAVGVTASLVLLDPYKPYAPAVLAALVPVLITLLRLLRRSAGVPWLPLVGQGAAVGLALGLLFLTYSGWFVWSAPGMVAAVLLLFPWRGGPLRGLAFLGMTTVTFVAVAWSHLWGLLRGAGSAADTYLYFDVYVEPAYIAMTRGSLPGNPGPWPPPGELGGAGVFSLLLVVGLGLAIWLAGRRTVVIALTLLLASVWIMRFWFASQMYETATVQLYPRTQSQLLYCSLLLLGFAVYFGVERVQGGRPAVGALPPADRAPLADRGAPRSTAVVGVIAAMLALGLFVGSSTADRYMPRDDDSLGILAYVSQLLRQPDGSCPVHGPDCADSFGEVAELPDRIKRPAPTGAGD